MEQVSTIGLDIAKHVFQVHGADAVGHVLFRKRVTRTKLLGFLAAQQPCIVAMEACAGAHYWAREIGKLGHRVRLIAPAYVKPFVSGRRTTRPMPRRSVRRHSARACVSFRPRARSNRRTASCFDARDLLVRQRTQCINALRGHLLEYGYIFPQGISHVATLVAVVEDVQSLLPQGVRPILKLLVDTFTALEGQIAQLDAEINQRSRADPTARRLMTIPGVGPIIATAITALAPAAQGFAAGRDFAAWLGLTPVQRSTGGKQKLGAVSKTRRTDHPPPADHRCECRGSTGQP